MATTLIVTRPEPQCGAWVERLQALGQPAQALPLLRIEAAPEFASALHVAWNALAAYRLVMFVSPNAVEHFFTHRPADRPWPLATLAGATGPGTVAALRAHGVPEVCIAAPHADSSQFDADTLWQQQLSQLLWAGRLVLIVRGEAGRDWLAQTLRAHGATVTMLAAYRQAAPIWDAPALALLQTLAGGSQPGAWLFSSSQAIRHLLDVRPQLPPDAAAALQRMPALATHPRIAETARQSGWQQVMPVRPEPDAVVTALIGIGGSR